MTHEFYVLWTRIPDWAKPVILATAFTALGWCVLKVVHSIGRTIRAAIKYVHDRRIEVLSLKVWKFVKSQCGASTSAIPLDAVTSHFRVSRGRAKEALQALKAKGMLRPNVDESLWYSDALTRFYN
jgi:hypothetical protein